MNKKFGARGIFRKGNGIAEAMPFSVKSVCFLSRRLFILEDGIALFIIGLVIY